MTEWLEEPKIRQTHILTWNPKYEEISDSAIEQTILDLEHGSTIIRSWNVGRHKNKFLPGDLVYLLRQGNDRRGIVAKGKLISSAYEDTFRGDPDKSSNFVKFELLSIVPIDNRLSFEVLKRYEMDHFNGTNWSKDFRESGKTLPPHDAETLWELWINNLKYPRSKCPSCGKYSVLRILYGMPMDNPRNLLLDGIVLHAGCVVFSDSPNGECVSCDWSGDTVFRSFFKSDLKLGSAKKRPPRKKSR